MKTINKITALFEYEVVRETSFGELSIGATFIVKGSCVPLKKRDTTQEVSLVFDDSYSMELDDEGMREESSVDLFLFDYDSMVVEIKIGYIDIIGPDKHVQVADPWNRTRIIDFPDN